MVANDAGIDELRALQRNALADVDVLVAGLSPSLMTRPTPCEGWDVRALVEHMVGLNMGFAEAFRAGACTEDSYRSRPVCSWIESRDMLVDATAELEPGRTVVIAPVSTELSFSARDAVVIHLLDITVHAWDLASALGMNHQPSDQSVAAIADMAALIAARPLPSTEEQFSSPLPAIINAPAWTRVLRLLGRDPSWRSPDSSGVLHPDNPNPVI